MEFAICHTPYTKLGETLADMKRRTFLQNSCLAAAAITSPRLLAGDSMRFSRNPFTLGVASGYPTPDGFMLWTRLAPEPLAPDGGMQPATVPVTWEIAGDAGMRKVLRRGTTYASADWAHSVHLEINALEPARPYWYRFTAGGVQSPIGRSCTTGKTLAPLQRLRLALASCQQYEHGYYVAYRRMLQDELDLVLHVGDYIYETGSSNQRVRNLGAGEAYTLDDYRARYALYKSDHDLQAAHAMCPWLVTWDDHETDNDYANDVSEQDDDPALFLQRRAVAYRAYYEHMPLPHQAAPFGASMRLHAQRTFGDLASICMLDQRQYRTPQACPTLSRRGGNRIQNCAERMNPARTMLGNRQEAWLSAQLSGSRSRWNLLAQGVVMAKLDEQPGDGERYWSDAWNGYPAARQRLLQSLLDSRATNPLVLSGDIHAFMASDLSLSSERADTPIIASELVTTSITSQAVQEELLQALLPENSGTRFVSGLHRGYVRLELQPELLRADLIAMETVQQPESSSRILQSFVVEAGQPGLQAV